jgi:hypothetical protein
MQERIKKEGRILVSAQNKNLVWTFKGVGLVAIPYKFAKSEVLDFQQLQEVNSSIEKVSFSEKESSLSLQLKFLNKTYPLQFDLQEEVLPAGYRLYFRSRNESFFKGIEGRLSLEVDQSQTLFTFLATAEKMPSWIPHFLIQVAVEGIMHHSAEVLRKRIEKDYKVSSLGLGD